MGKKKGGENIRVAIRVRNLLPHETENGHKNAVRVDLATNQVIVQHPIGDPDMWAFDAIFNNTFKQKDIFVQEVRPLVDSVLQGYNATVFAYGQSGSGKTFTMTGNLESGDPSQYGMMPQVVDYLFEEIKRLSSNNKIFKVKVSYVELYNGKSRDLLADRQVSLEIKQNMAGNFFVKGAEVIEVTNWKECMDQFHGGTERRRTASTDLNAHSSRSHSLFSLTLEQHDFEHDPSSPIIIVSKINVVDLAGSEKLGKTNATGDTMVEGCNINLSLSALATVIDKIVKGSPHVPYRGNPLTMLLKDSLGGNSKTVMFANIGPSDQNVSETISTLRFAERAKQIENKPIKNLDPKDAKIQELLDKIEELQRRCNGADLDAEEKLKERISELEIENSDLKNAGSKDTIELEETNRQQAHQLAQMEQALREKDNEVAGAMQKQALIEANLRGDMEHLQGLRSGVVNFLKRIMTDDQQNMIRQHMPQELEQAQDGNWDVREIQFFMDGFQEMYEDWRRSVFTQEDLQKEGQRVRAEVEQQMSFHVQQLESEKAELLRQREEEFRNRSANSEAQSQQKVDLQNLRDENQKLQEKIRRDQEKMKGRNDKAKEEIRALAEELDGVRTEVQSRDREIERLKRHVEEAQMNGGGGGGGTGSFNAGGGGGSPQKWSQEKQELMHELDSTKARMREMIMAMRRKGICVANADQMVNGNGGSNAPPPPPPPPNGDPNAPQEQALVPDAHNQALVLDIDIDASNLDNDLVSTMQQQLRVQHRLHELRHAHQRKLDDLVNKFELLKTGKVTATASSSGGEVSEEVLQARIREALRMKEDEMEHQRIDHEKAMEKLAKKINKKVAEFKEREATLMEDKQSLEEERQELQSHVEDLNRFNHQLSVEVENHRAILENIQNQAESEARIKGAEILHLRNEGEQLKHRLETQARQIEDYNNLQTEFRRMQELHQRTETSLKEKISALDNNRQMMKWTSSLLDAEKEKVANLEMQLREAERQYNANEEQWRQNLVDSANKLVAANNARLQDQSDQHQAALAEEQEKQKAIREKFRKAKIQTNKAAQKFDEMVLENEILQTQFEDLKVQTLRMARGQTDHNQMADTNANLRNVIRGQQRNMDNGMPSRGW